MILVSKGFDSCFELPQALVRALAALVNGPVHQHVGHGLSVALDQAVQQLQQFFAPVRRQAADHAEVDKRNGVARQVKHIAQMWVSMKTPVFDNYLQHRLRAAPRQASSVRSKPASGVSCASASPATPSMKSCVLTRSPV